MSDREFAEALARAQGGDEAAVGALWRTHHPFLLRFLQTRHTTSDVEDVASEVWLRVSSSWCRFEGDERDFRAWFFSIARATSVDWYRRLGRRREVASSVADESNAAHSDAAEALALDAMSTDQALKLLRELPREQAEVIALRVIAGLDTERVAKIMDKRPGTVRVLQHRGLRRLAQLVQVGVVESDVTG